MTQRYERLIGKKLALFRINVAYVGKASIVLSKIEVNVVNLMTYTTNIPFYIVPSIYIINAV